MAFELPDEAVAAASTPAPAAAPVASEFQLPNEAAADSGGGFSLPADATKKAIPDLVADEDFDPVSYAIETGDDATAKEVAWGKKQAPMTLKRAGKMFKNFGGAAVDMVHDFGSGLGQVGTDAWYQAHPPESDFWKEQGISPEVARTIIDKAALQQAARAQLIEHNTKGFYGKLFGEEGLLAPAGRRLSQGLLGLATYVPGVDDEKINNAILALEDENDSRKEDPRIYFDYKFDQAVKDAKEAGQIASGHLQNKGAIASAGKALDALFSGQANEDYKLADQYRTPEELAGNFAPVDADAVRQGAVAGDPINLLPLHLPGAAPILNTVAGAALRAPVKVATAVAEHVPVLRKLGKYGLPAVAGTLATHDLLEGDVEGAAKKVLGLAGVYAGAKAAKVLGHVVDNAGAKLMNPKFVSEAEKAAASEAMAGKSMFFNGKANLADAERVTSKVVQGAVSAPVSMAPLNYAISDSPEEFAQLEGGVTGFGTFAGATGYNPATGFHPETIQAADAVLREQGAKKNYGSPLDAAHNDFMQSAPEWVRNGVNAYRGFFDGFKMKNGQEPKIFVLPADQFAAEAVKRDPTLTPELAKQQRGLATKDGTIIVNGSFGGEAPGILGHEAGGHVTQTLMEMLAPHVAERMQDAAYRSLLTQSGKPTAKLRKFVDGYNKAFDPTGQRREIQTNDKAIEEWLAEQARAVLEGQGPAKYAVGESVRQGIADNIGDYFQKAFGAKRKFDRSEVPTLAREYRNMLFELGRLRGTHPDPAVEQAPAPAGVDPSVPPPEGSPAPEAAPAPAMASARPAPAPAPAAAPVATGDSFADLGISQSLVRQVRRDFVAEGGQEPKGVRANKRKNIESKSPDEVMAEREAEFDEAFNGLADFARTNGYDLPLHPQDLRQLVREYQIDPEAYRQKFAKQQEGPRADKIEAPKEGDPQPGDFAIFPGEEEALKARGWSPEEIGMMPFHQVQAEVAAHQAGDLAPATASAPNPVTLTPAGVSAQPNSPTGAAAGELSAFNPHGTNETAGDSLPAGGTAGAPQSLPDRLPAARTGEVPAVSEEQITQALADADAAAEARAAKVRGGAKTSAEDRKAQITREERIAALGKLLDPADPGLHPVADPVTGKTTFEGPIDPANPVHAAILSEFGYTPEHIDRLAELQDNAGRGVVLRDYNAAEQEGHETGEGLDLSGEKRGAEYQASPTGEAGQRQGRVTKQDKGFTPWKTILTNKGVLIRGFDHDKFLGNLREVLDAAAEAGLETGLDGKKGAERDEAIAEAFRKIAENHANGWKGDGSEPLQVFPDSGIQQNLDYVGQPVDSDLANAVNMAMHIRSARPPKPPRGDKPGEEALRKFAASNAEAKEAQGLAQLNDGFLNPETGETNPLRDQLEAHGFETDKRMKPTVSNVRADLIEGGIHDTPTHGKNVHAHGFDIAPSALTVEGSPRAKPTAAGFMPGDGEPSIKSKVEDEGGLSRFMPGSEQPEFFDESAVKSEKPSRWKSDKYKDAGETVDGREVINADNIPNQASISAELGGNYKILPGIKEVPMADFPGLNGEHYSVRGQDKIDRLADAIKNSEQITPLIVVEDAQGPYVLEGSTRAEALFKLGAKSFPAMVVKDTTHGSEHFMPGDGEGQNNLNADTEKNIRDARMMAPKDPAGFLRKMADSARAHGKEEAAANFEAAIAALNKPSGELSGFMPGEGEQLEGFKPEQDELGFISGLSKIVADKIPNRASADQILATLKSNGAKAEEMEYMGLPEFLKTKGGPVTKQELQDFIKAGGVQFKEVVKGGSQFSPELKSYIEANLHRAPSTPDGWTDLGDDFQKIAQKLDRKGDAEEAKKYWDLATEASYQAEGVDSESGSSKAQPKFSQYSLPGGENYKEVLLTLPDGPKDEGLDDYLARTKNGDGQFHSSHWDEPNVLAHIRLADHTDAEGNKVRLIEEIQSDWHQKGRKEGYAQKLTEEQKSRIEELRKMEANLDRERAGKSAIDTLPDGWMDDPNFSVTDYVSRYESTPERTKLREQMEALQNERLGIERLTFGVPDAPFKKTWPELAFKRALRMAVEDGADKIAWVTGEIAADRFDLSKQVDSLSFTTWPAAGEGMGILSAYKDGNQVVKKTVKESSLPSEIGKDVAAKLIAAEKDPMTGQRYIEGEDLKVGGEGMKGFYDKILPDFARKYVKKWGGKVETVGLSHHDEGGETYQYQMGVLGIRGGLDGYMVNDIASGHVLTESGELSADRSEAKVFPTRRGAEAAADETQELKVAHPHTSKYTVHSIAITPEMKEAVLQGQPMFMPGGERTPKGKPLEDFDSTAREGESSIKSKVAPLAGFMPGDKEEPIPANTRDRNFKKWAGKNAQILDNPLGEEIDPSKPLVVRVDHGSTHDFNAIDAERGNPENHFGKGFYGTDSTTDAGENYAGEGPDLTARIERRSENVENEIHGMDASEIADHFGIDEAKAQAIVDGEDAQYSSPEARARRAALLEIARKELHGGTAATYRVWMKMENPLVVEKNGGTRFDALEKYDEESDSYEENPDSLPVKLYDSIQENAGQYGIDGQSLWNEVSEAIGGEWDGVTAYEVDKAMRGSNSLMEASDSEGNSDGPDFIKEVFRGMGFDGIVMDADEAFGGGRAGKGGKGMAMDYGTRHYIVFEPQQVKSAIGNKGTFDPANPDMRFMAGEKGSAPVAHDENGTTLFAKGVHFMPADAYHGTPHEVDKFSSERIGTGEGAQAFGWGLYFAENPKVADEYRKRLSDAAAPGEYEWKGKVFKSTDYKDPERHAITLAFHQGKAEAVTIAKQGLRDAKAGEAYALESGGVDYYQKMLETANSIRSAKDIKFKQGQLYKVRLNVEPDELIHADLPLADQPEAVKDLVRDILKKGRYLRADDNGPRQLTSAWKAWLGENAGFAEKDSGSAIYGAIAKAQGGERQASEYLTTLGIHGIKYADEGSRTKRSGKTFNYVIFDDSKIKVTQKNGKPVDIASFMPGSEPKRTWFMRDGKRVYHQRHASTGMFAPKQTLAKAPSGALSSDDKKALADFQ